MRKKYKITIIVVLFIIVWTIWFCYDQNNDLGITKINGKADIKNPIKIIHLSDLHGKQFGKYNKKLYDKIVSTKADLIVFTGDLIDANGKNIDETVAFMGKLNKIVPVFYVAGNHEHRSGKIDEIVSKLKENNIKILLNELDTVEIGKTKINVLGIDEDQGSYEDYSERAKGQYEYKDNSDLFAKLSRQEGLKLVLSHYPENFALIGNKSYKNYSFDFMFSGHAHGGQWILPFIGGVFAPGQGIHPKYYSGLYGDGPRMIVSRGLGNSSFPLRLFNKPEIIEVNIMPKDK